MVTLGYKLSSEEPTPSDLISAARRAEEADFGFGMISDHYHPWTDKQGQSPFVWSVIGGISQVTRRLSIGTGVTCPTVRIHPAIVARAAETVREEDITKTVPCDPDPERHRAAITPYPGAGFDHVAIHQIGPDQEGFFRFYEKEILPAFR